MAWYLNPALTTMRNEVNARWPSRDKASDGTIGDEAHQGTSSDHNPDGDGSVDAWDMDVNLYGPSGGTPSGDLEFLKQQFEKHEAAQYWIHNRKIASRSYGTTSNGRWVVRNYSGSNPHDKHIHFNTRSEYENSTKPWGIEEAGVSKDHVLDAFNDNLPWLSSAIERDATAEGWSPDGRSLQAMVQDMWALMVLKETEASIPRQLAELEKLVRDVLAAVGAAAGTTVVLSDEQVSQIVDQLCEAVTEEAQFNLVKKTEG